MKFNFMHFPCRPTRRSSAVAFLVLALIGSRAQAEPIEVFRTDFDSATLPAEVSAPGAHLVPVQGFSGLGPEGRTFGGNLLHYDTTVILPTTITLRDLPPHVSVDLEFLLALIDSWDGTEVFEIRLDGQTLFSHTFQLALGDTSDYEAPEGVLLSRGSELGFTSGFYYWHDRAYDLGADPSFRNIPHTADSLVLEFTLGAVSGPAADQWQGGTDESWGLDAVRIEVQPPATSAASPSPAHVMAIRSLRADATRPGFVEVELQVPEDVDPAATLDFFGASGRRVASLHVGALGTGVHRLSTLVPRGLVLARSPGASTRGLLVP